MSSLYNIQIGSNSPYELRSKWDCEYVELSYSAAFTWTGTLSSAQPLYDGKQILIKVPHDVLSSASITLTLTVGSSTVTKGVLGLTTGSAGYYAILVYNDGTDGSTSAWHSLQGTGLGDTLYVQCTSSAGIAVGDNIVLTTFSKADVMSAIYNQKSVVFVMLVAQSIVFLGYISYTDMDDRLDVVFNLDNSFGPAELVVTFGTDSGTGDWIGTIAQYVVKNPWTLPVTIATTDWGESSGVYVDTITQSFIYTPMLMSHHQLSYSFDDAMTQSTAIATNFRVASYTVTPNANPLLGCTVSIVCNADIAPTSAMSVTFKLEDSTLT